MSAPLHLTPADVRHVRTWAAALRSGEYTQCFHHLESDGAHCVLGVERRVAGAKVCDQHWWFTSGPQRRLPKLLSSARLPSGASPNQLGELLPWPASEPDGLPQTLASLNDFARLTFPQLADVLEYVAEHSAEPTGSEACS